MKKAIAMRCTREQYEEIKPKLKDLNKIKGAQDFDRLEYLTNNFGWKDVIGLCGSWAKDSNFREVHETWNEKVFLEAFGIETEPEYVITKEQIIDLVNAHDFDDSIRLIKEWFPDAFKEDKVELEFGRWYKSGKSLFNHQEGKNSYGFRFGKWQQNNWSTSAEYFGETITEATPEEITEALTKEAVKRYKVGNYFKCAGSRRTRMFDDNDIVYIEEYNNGIYLKGSKNGEWLMINGKWAEIIPTITKEDAEKEIGKKIV